MVNDRVACAPLKIIIDLEFYLGNNDRDSPQSQAGKSILMELGEESIFLLLWVQNHLFSSIPRANEMSCLCWETVVGGGVRCRSIKGCGIGEEGGAGRGEGGEMEEWNEG